MKRHKNFDLPYLWCRRIKKPSGLVIEHWCYRRGRAIIRIMDGRVQLRPTDGGRFATRWAEINSAYERSPDAPSRAEGTFDALIAEYKAAPEFRSLAEVTQRDYARYLDDIGDRFGKFPVAGLTRETVLDLRNRYQDTPRKATMAVAVLRRLCNFAIDRPSKYRLERNPCDRVQRLKGGAGYIAWRPDQIAAFRAAASPEMALALEVGLHTTLRRGDAVCLPWAGYNGEEITLVTSKRGVPVTIPVSPPLKAVLDATPRVAPTILATPAGRPWSVDGFTHAFKRTMDAAGVAGVNFHGLRATFAELNAGKLTDAEIESVLGNSMAKHYRRGAARKELARSAMMKVNDGKN